MDSGCDKARFPRKRVVQTLMIVVRKSLPLVGWNPGCRSDGPKEWPCWCIDQTINRDRNAACSSIVWHTHTHTSLCVHKAIVVERDHYLHDSTPSAKQLLVYRADKLFMLRRSEEEQFINFTCKFCIVYIHRSRVLQHVILYSISRIGLNDYV